MTEMQRLISAFNEHGISWDDNGTNMLSKRVNFTLNGKMQSVVYGWNTIGGQEGLLEAIPPINEYGNIGLTSDDIMKLYKTIDMN